jgi:hypothetical protein
VSLLRSSIYLSFAATNMPLKAELRLIDAGTHMYVPSPIT